jgi:capsular exopolysaccharide synthesis family protein
MDHISKALERAQAARGNVRSWVLPAAESPSLPATAQTTSLRSVTLPVEHLRQQHILSGRALGLEDPAVSDMYRLLRTRVIQSMRKHGWRSVGITSAGARVGKSLTAINLAISIARDGSYNVALVDADLRRPSTATMLGIDDGPGLIDYLATERELESVLIKPDVENLMILPGRGDSSGVAVPELLTSKKMVGLVGALQQSFGSNLLIVDLPPILVGDDVVAVGPLFDCLLVVIAEGETEVEDLRKAAELVKQFNIVGTVLNKSSEKTKRNAGYYYYGTANET